MTMRMLHAGGVPARDGTDLWSMEHPNSGHHSGELELIRYLPFPGQAVKILEMELVKLPRVPRPGVVPVVMWCTRDRLEQAKSARKLLALAQLAGHIDEVIGDPEDIYPFMRGPLEENAAFWETFEQRGRAYIEKMGWPASGWSFEATIQHPRRQADRMWKMLNPWWPNFDVEAAAAVPNDRDFEARDGLDQEESDRDRYGQERSDT